MSTPTIADLADAALPTVLRLVDDLAATVGSSPSVSRIQLLTSPAAMTADQELAFLVGVRDDDVADLWSVLDLLMAAEFGAILPGWRDLADGLEHVYLLPWQGSLLRVRMRLAATGRLHLAPHQVPGHAVHVKPADRPVLTGRASPVLDLLSDERTAARTVTDHVVAGLVLLHRMSDHVRAGRFLACHADLERVRLAVCGLLGHTVAAGVDADGWYGMDTALEATPLGRQCLALVRELLSTPAPGSRLELAAVVDCFLRIVATAGLPADVELAGPIDSFRRYLRIL